MKPGNSVGKSFGKRMLSGLSNHIKKFAFGSLSSQKFFSHPFPDLSDIATEQLQESYRAGLVVQEVLDQLAKNGQSILDLILNEKPHQMWEHYPWQGGILDQRHSSQYFYHSHDDYPDEHGHFHTFYYHQRQLAHLVAVGLNESGELLKLYTFNCWGPGDVYFPADQLKHFLSRFRIEGKQKFDLRSHTFIQNILHLFRAEIEYLFEQRDETFRQYREQNNGNSPFEDRSLEITSGLEVDLDDQIERLGRELTHRKANLQAELHAELPDSSEVSQKLSIKLTDPMPQKPEMTPMEPRSPEQIQQSYAAGQEISALIEEFKAEGKNITELVMNGQPLEVWRMYPWDGGVVDQNNKSQYFYHSHPQSPEHGHFHTFYHHKNQLVHLIAIALDNAGEPIELMTVNRWVTGDLYVPAKKLKTFLRRFRVNNRAPDQRIYQFIRNLFLLYQPEIEMLMDQREQTFQQYRQENNGQSPFEDRSLEVTSSLKIEIASHVLQLEQALS